MRRDNLTRDLFEVPEPVSPSVGAMAYRGQVCELLAEMFAASGLDRYAIAAEASRLTGRDVSKNMLDAYTSPAREEFNAPAWLIPALEAVCKSHGFTRWLAGVRGGRLYVGRAALEAELGRYEALQGQLQTKIRLIKRQIGGGEA